MSSNSLLALGIVAAGIMALKLLKKPPQYDCVNNQCVEKADGPYNDSTCMGMCAAPPTDKYYGCVNNQCVEKADGQYKNDPTCQGTCAPPEIIDAEIMSLAAVPTVAPDINPGEWFNIDADIRNTGNVASKFYISISWRMAGGTWQGQDIDYDFELNDRIKISPIWFLPANYASGFWHDIKAEVYADSARTQLLDSKQINSAFYVK